ncbi:MULTISPECIES: nitroreductase family protein [unclassified Leifsonia]|uniref:nitroreductase family protein n=1 Tax=unclassified Leifsonia TaxID=2663824 RepID=UPI000A19A891|nr:MULTISPECIES: nitroreductase family protein [unclassified Leifsonia]QJA00161.1 nitroreductase [Leifsonia sp. PS1209]
MSIAELNSRAAVTAAPLIPALAERWSPRAFDPTAVVPETALTAALEAARWSPSASNTQPWRFIVARRGSAEFDTIASALMGFNQAWAGSASALIVAIAEMEDAEGTPRRWATYDLGQAVAHLSVQAHHDGLHVHQMGGFDVDALRSAFDIEERFVPTSVSAIGILGDPEALPDPLRERELAPRSRAALDEIVVVNA